MLRNVCNAKYGGTDRIPFYNLGFTDQDIDAKSTVNLTVEMLKRIDNVLR